MDKTRVSSTSTTYRIVDNYGSEYSAYGTLTIIGDFVTIGNSVFYRPLAVQEYKK